MPRDPLKTLLILRRRGQDEARQALSRAVQHETDTAKSATAAAAAIMAEQQAAMDLQVGDGAVEAFAAWLPTGRATAAQAWSAAERAQADVVRARALLAAAQSAARTVEALLEQRAAAYGAAAARRAQATLDEAAGRLVRKGDE